MTRKKSPDTLKKGTVYTPWTDEKKARAQYIGEVRFAWSTVVNDGNMLRTQTYISRLDLHHLSSQLAIFAHILGQEEDRALLLLHDVRNVKDEHAANIQAVCTEVFQRLCDVFMMLLEADEDEYGLIDRIRESRNTSLFPELVPQTESKCAAQPAYDTTVAPKKPSIPPKQFTEEPVLAKPPIIKSKKDGRSR